MYLHEEAREAGWDDEQILEAIAAVSLEAFTAMVNVAGEVPGRRLDRGVAGARGRVGRPVPSMWAALVHRMPALDKLPRR